MAGGAAAEKSMWARELSRLHSNALQDHVMDNGMQSLTNDPFHFKWSLSRPRLYLGLRKPSKYKGFVAYTPMKLEQMMAELQDNNLTRIENFDLIFEWFIAHLRKEFK